MNTNKRKNLSKLLSVFIGCAGLFVPMSVVLLGCNQATDNTQTSVNTNDVVLNNGIADWYDFKNKAIEKVVDPTTSEEKYSFSKEITNKSEIKGFSGYAEYSDVKMLLESSLYNTKQYDTKNLSIYFNYVAQDGAGQEITPSVLNQIYKNFNVVNISDVNPYGEKTPIKFSCGDASVGEIFDLEKFYSRIVENRLSVPDDAIITQSTTSVNLIGVEDPFLRGKVVSDADKLLKVLSSPLFVNSEIDIVKLSGNLKPIFPLFEKEAEAGNISFDSEAYYASFENEKDNVSLKLIQDMVLRGAKPNLYSVNVVGDDTTLSPDMKFDFATLKDVSFLTDVDLSLTSFDFVNSSGKLEFLGVLPSSMKYLNAEEVSFENAVVPDLGTNITGANISALKIKNLQNHTAFIKDAGASNGKLNEFYGNQSCYDVLKNIFDIPYSGVHIDLITMLLLNSRQNIYS